MKTTSNITAEIFEAESRRDALESRVGELKDQLAKLPSQQVSQAVYVGAVVETLEGQIRKFEKAALQAVNNSAMAGAFARIDYVGSQNGGTAVDFAQTAPSDPSPIQVALEESKVPPHVAVLAMMGPAALGSVRAWAAKHAAAAGCPEEAPAPEDLAEQSVVLRGQLQACIDEMRGLNALLGKLYAEQHAARVKANGGHVQRGSSVIMDGTSA